MAKIGSEEPPNWSDRDCLQLVVESTYGTDWFDREWLQPVVRGEHLWDRLVGQRVATICSGELPIRPTGMAESDNNWKWRASYETDWSDRDWLQFAVGAPMGSTGRTESGYMRDAILNA